MFDRARSGQVLPFCLVSAISGNPVTGASGQISGRKVIDAGVQVLLSGNIVETSGGTYRANFHSEDIDGNIIGYYFTASGCVPVHYTVVTQQNVSGRVYPASGVNATTSIASGTVFLASGQFLFGSGQFYLGSGHPATLYSGQVVGLYSGQTVGLFSGQQVAVVSGTFVNTWSGQTQIASGPFVVATVSLTSGQVFLASGTPVVAAIVNDKSGYTLHSSGLDTIPVEAGMNARQALAAIAAVTAGRLSGAGTAAVRIDGANVSGTNRIAAVVDASGNRTSVILTLPG